MAAHSRTLAWRIPETEEPGGLQSMRSQGRTRLRDFTFAFYQLSLLLLWAHVWDYYRLSFHGLWRMEQSCRITGSPPPQPRISECISKGKNLRHRFSGLFVNLDLWKDFLCKLCILNPLHLPGVSRNKTERNTGVAWFPRACSPQVAFMKGEAAPRQPDGGAAALPSEYASQTSCADAVPSLSESQNRT